MVWTHNGHQKGKESANLGNLKYQYDEVYSDVNYGPILTAHGLLASMAVSQRIKPPMDILCVGSGNAYEAVHFKNRGHRVTTLDYHAPKVKYLSGQQVIGDCCAIPFKDNAFELVMCCEMLEHVPEYKAYDCLSELFRVGKKFRFTIADKLDPYGDLHLCVKDIYWWRERMEKIGYEIFHMEIKPYFMIFVKTSTGELGMKEWYYPTGYMFDAFKRTNLS
jgi:ubiquinone/menaquinone biosynthesis C-methylase UbiE